ncbi:MAG: hypothetical protein VB020_04075 [Methanocorpusculum sp.]|nr:hypothetical protein [Methanocorpusculum sp.]
MVILAEYTCPSTKVPTVGLHTIVGVPTPVVVELGDVGEFPVTGGVKVRAMGEEISMGVVSGKLHSAVSDFLSAATVIFSPFILFTFTVGESPNR